METSLLSILIPAFRREAELIQLLETLRPIYQSDLIEVLIGDDSAPVFISIDDNYLNGSVRLIRNEHNLGMAENLVNLIKIASGKFVMFMADDDSINTDELLRLVKYLSRFKASDVFLSTCYLRNGKVYRGSLGARNAIKAGQLLEASSHSPGIVFNRNKLLYEVEESLSYLRSFEIFTLYPQVLFVIILFSKYQTGFWYIPFSPVRNGYELPTGLSFFGKDYSVISSRIDQLAEFRVFTDQVLSNKFQTKAHILNGVERFFWTKIFNQILTLKPPIYLLFRNGIKALWLRLILFIRTR